MYHKRKLWLSLLSACIAVILVMLLYWLQVKHMEWQETIHVVSMKQFVPAGTMIESRMLTYKPILKGDYEDNMLRSEETAVGKQTLVPLGKGEALLDWKLSSFELLPSRDQSTFEIPKPYILSMSGGIRAGDLVRLYVTSGESGAPRRLLEEEIVVASVKGADNVEIEDESKASLLYRAENNAEAMYYSRRTATSPIAQINLNLTEEQWLLLDRACGGQGAKLVIALTSTAFHHALAIKLKED